MKTQHLLSSTIAAMALTQPRAVIVAADLIPEVPSGFYNPPARFVPNNIQSARVEPQNRRRSYRAQVRAAAKRRNIAKRGGAK